MSGEEVSSVTRHGVSEVSTTRNKNFGISRENEDLVRMSRSKSTAEGKFSTRLKVYRCRVKTKTVSDIVQDINKQNQLRVSYL